MKKQSAGVLMYRFISGQIQFLLVHPGGPFWAKKDTGVWSIPKGEFEDEDPKEAAKREFLEETGAEIKGELVRKVIRHNLRKRLIILKLLHKD